MCPPVKLDVAHVVVAITKRGHDATAATVDGKDLVLRAVGDEDGGSAGAPAGRNEPGGEGHDGPEQAAVGQSDAERVRRAVGETANGQALLIDGVVAERPVEGLIDQIPVRAVAAQERVPGAAAGPRREEEEPFRLGMALEGAETRLRFPPGAVQHDQERQGRVLRPVPARHVQQRVPRTMYRQVDDAGGRVRCLWPEGPDVEASVRR